LGHADDVQLVDIVLEECVGDAVADSFAAARDDGDFAGEVGALFEAPLRGGQLLGRASEVLGNCVLRL
jgi:hypothetical protein